MIPGDIDLTQNLDFRNVKKKEMPQLPVSWEGNKLNTLNVDNSYISSLTTSTTINNNITYTIYPDDDEPITFSDLTIVNTDEELSWRYYSNENYLTTTSSSYTITSWNAYYEDYIYYDFDTNKTTISLECKPKKKYDVFGNLIKDSEPIPEIPWKEKRKYNYDGPIPWKRKSRQWIRYDSEPAIPWDTDDDWGWNNYDKPNLSRPYDRAKHLISWLFGKSRTFIERYFDTEDEKVDLSYLTNMSWIRVHDAVINSI